MSWNPFSRISTKVADKVSFGETKGNTCGVHLHLSSSYSNGLTRWLDTTCKATLEDAAKIEPQPKLYLVKPKGKANQIATIGTHMIKGAGWDLLKWYEKLFIKISVRIG